MFEHHRLPYAWGGPVAAGRFKAAPEDFEVCEIPICKPEGEGEHVWLQVRKTGLDTEATAARIAAFAGVPHRQVNYAGMKDRHAVTEQWFSVHMPGMPDPDWTGLGSGELQVLASARHRRKLQRGALRGNRFRIRLCDLQGDRAALDKRLDDIGHGGIPNYFGPQRFGRQGANLQAALDWFDAGQPRVGRFRRGLYLSAARSFLFNQVLAWRVTEGSWNRVLPGEVVHLDGTRSRFRIDQVDDEIAERLAALDIHPGGPLWGRGEPEVQADCAALEAACLAEFDAWRHGLERAGLRHDRRPLRVRVRDLGWTWEDGDLVLDFSLPPGSYATSVVRELIDLDT